MRALPFFSGIIAAIVTCSAFNVMLHHTEADEQQKVTVPVAEVDRTVVLIGRLGHPLGTMMEIRGTWRYPPVRKSSQDEVQALKDNSLRFVVSHVNGKTLKQPLDIHRISARNREGKDAIQLETTNGALLGDTWTLRGFETGHYTRIPEEYWKETGIGSVASPVWQQPFQTEFVGIVTQEVEGSGIRSN